MTERLLGREGDDELGMAVAVFGRKVLRRVEPVDGERFGFGGADLRGGNLAAVEQVDDPLMACSGLGFEAGCLRREREGAQQPARTGTVPATRSRACLLVWLVVIIWNLFGQ